MGRQETEQKLRLGSDRSLALGVLSVTSTNGASASRVRCVRAGVFLNITTSLESSSNVQEVITTLDFESSPTSGNRGSSSTLWIRRQHKEGRTEQLRRTCAGKCLKVVTRGSGRRGLNTSQSKP